MTCGQLPAWLAFGILFLKKKEECLAFVSSPPAQQQQSQDNKHHVQAKCMSPPLVLCRPATTAVVAGAAAGATTRASSPSSRTALHATGFGAPPPAPRRPRPDPSAYHPNDDDDNDDDDDDDGHSDCSSSSRDAVADRVEDGGEEPFPALRDPRKAEEPRGIGTLFESEDEVIRELSSEEYTDLLRDWAPIASFASVEAVDVEVKEEARCILNVLRGMAEWQPKRNADYTKLGSKWSFGAPIGAIKGGQVDALACLQVSEDEGVVVEWICGNPVTLGIPGNAVDWLARGVHVLCGKRLDLPVTISPRARGEGGVDDGGGGGVGGGGGGGGLGWGQNTRRVAGRRRNGGSGKGKGGSKKRR